MAVNEQGLDPDKDYTQTDNEFWDCSDGAHPAWWRGEKFGCEAMTRLMTEWLDKPLEELKRGCHQAGIQALKERVLELRAKHGF